MLTDQQKSLVVSQLYPETDRYYANGVLQFGPEMTLTDSELDALYLPQLLEYSKTVKREYLMDVRVEKLNAGMPYTFEGIPEIVQTRDQDKTNLLGISVMAMQLTLQGVAEACIPFMVESNVEYLLTPAEASQMTMLAGSYTTGIYKRHWALKQYLLSINVDTPDALNKIESLDWDTEI